MSGLTRIVFVVFLLWMGSGINVLAQLKGCTDPRALNYIPSAISNDGSCLYEKTNCKPRTVAYPLPAKLIENSGMFEFNGLVWFHNDSGGEPELYGYDTLTDQILAVVRLLNAGNVDWEDICQDSLFVYIGDIGNNSGGRKDLTIYKVSKKVFPSSGNVTVHAELITFGYPDQVDFTHNSNEHNFDCEAFVSARDSLYLFSKNWLNQWTKIYRLPKKPGNYTAELLDSFNVKGLVSAADYSESKKELVLLGYENYVPFFWLMFDFRDNDFLSGNKRRIDFGVKAFGSQTEAVCFDQKLGAWISSEKSSLIDNKLVDVYTWNWTKPLFSGENEKKLKIRVFTNPASFQFSFEVDEDFSGLNIEVLDSLGHVVRKSSYEHVSKGSFFSMDMSNLSKGNYILIIKSGNKVYREKIQKNQ